MAKKKISSRRKSSSWRSASSPITKPTVVVTDKAVHVYTKLKDTAGRKRIARAAREIVRRMTAPVDTAHISAKRAPVAGDPPVWRHTVPIPSKGRCDASNVIPAPKHGPEAESSPQTPQSPGNDNPEGPVLVLKTVTVQANGVITLNEAPVASDLKFKQRLAEHRLKSHPENFDEILGGRRLDVRRNDRGFKTGDTVILEEFVPQSQQYTGRASVMKIKTLIENVKGLQRGYCVVELEVKEPGRILERRRPST